MKGNIFSLVAVGVLACGGDERPDMREACLAQGEQVCHRAVQCALVSTYQTCLTEFMGGCCQRAGTCTKLVREGLDLEGCVAAIGPLSCQEISEGAVPTACMK